MKQIIPWSYSQLTCFETCALQYKFKYVDRALVAPGADMFYRDRGIAIHEKAEAFMKRRAKVKPPAELEKLVDKLNEAKTFKARAETALFLNNKWEPVHKGGHWGVVKADIHWVVEGTLAIIDLKSGRVRDYSDQGRIYIAGFWSLYAELERAYAEEWYTQTGETSPRRRTFHNRTQVMGIRKEIEQRVRLMQSEESYDPTPSAVCRWCDFSKQKGGPCRYG